VIAPHAHRAVDCLPGDLHEAVKATARRRHRQLAQLWDWCTHAAAADVLGAWAGKPSHPLPAPVDPRSIPLLNRKRIVWTVDPEIERTHLQLIQLGGSNRTAVLICAAQVYLRVDGDLTLLLGDRPPGQPWDELPG
jgi:hypothetical protein